MTGDERCLCCDGPRHIPGRPGRSGRGLCARCYARLRAGRTDLWEALA